uniref:Uncharacterized protein n=1 Tax=Sphaerodactylus townsendi TaxID=933632 RepID=A0ACB8ETX7_9SAUR
MPAACLAQPSDCRTELGSSENGRTPLPSPCLPARDFPVRWIPAFFSALLSQTSLPSPKPDLLSALSQRNKGKAHRTNNHTQPAGLRLPQQIVRKRSAVQTAVIAKNKQSHDQVPKMLAEKNPLENEPALRVSAGCN